MEKPNEKKNLTPEERTVASLALSDKVKRECKRYRKQFESEWKDYDDAYYGKQHKTGEKHKTVKNELFRIIEQELPVLTDSMPSTLLTAKKSIQQQATDILQKGMEFVYKEQNLQLMLPSLLRSSLISAPGIMRVKYNPDADSGDGKIELIEMDWKNVYLDGNAKTLESSSRAHFEEDIRRDELASLWPEKYDEIMGQKGKDLDDLRDHEGSVDYDGGDNAGPKGAPKSHRAEDILKYGETWVKSFELEAIPDEETQDDIAKENALLESGEPPVINKYEDHDAHMAGHAGIREQLISSVGLDPNLSYDELEQQVNQLVEQNPEAKEILFKGLASIKIIDNHNEEHTEFKKLNPKGQRPKYKDGWRVIKRVGKTLLYDGPNAEQNGMIPLVLFYCYKDKTIVGFGEIKNTIDAQRSLNTMDYAEYQGLKLNGNSGWIKDEEAGIVDTQLTNEQGLVVTKKKGTEVRRLEAGQVSPQFAMRRQNDKDSISSLAGQNEQSMNGAMPSGNVSGVTVTKLQTQAVGRIRLKNRNLDYYSMARLARLVCSLILNHWSEEKTLRFRNDQAEIEEFIFNPLEMQDLEYQVEMSPSSMAGVDKDAVNAFYMSIFLQGSIDLNSFLAVAEIPKKEILMKLMQGRDAQTQETQQALEQLQAQLQQIQTENVTLKGALDSGRLSEIELLSTDEQKVVESELKRAAINNLIEPSQQDATGSLQDVNPQTNGASNGQPI